MAGTIHIDLTYIPREALVRLKPLYLMCIEDGKPASSIQKRLKLFTEVCESYGLDCDKVKEDFYACFVQIKNI
jgi:hypothetical protein